MATIGEGLRTGGRGLSPGQGIALAVTLAAAAFLGWYGFQTVFGDGSSTAAPVQTVTVQPGTIQQTANTSGNIVAPQNSKLTFPLAGRLATIAVKPGQTVQKDDVIATLDTTQLRIALDTATSAQNTAQAKFDALLAGQTADVVEAARAGVAQAKAAQLTAENQLGTANTNKVTANNSVGTAQNQIATASNSVTTAHSQVLQAQATLETAQNNYQNLLNGPIPQDVAVTQAAIDSAKISLDTAQLNYDRLVNHVEIAIRPETTALTSAQKDYQAALSAYANAQPQPANPADIANAQLAINTAQQQVALAQQNSITAAQNLATANANAITGQISAPTAVSCVGLSNGGSACGPGSPAPPSTASATAAQDAVTAAQSQVASTTAAVITAQNAYQQAVNSLAKLTTPFTTTDFGGLKAQVDAAKAALDVAQRNYDNYLNLPDLAIRPETTALNTARSAYNTAKAQYDLKVAPPKDTDLANAQAQIQNAEAALASAQAAEANAGVAVSTASLAASSAAATAANSDTAIAAAAGGVDSAGATIQSAAKKLDQLTAPPLPTDVVQAQEQVRQAKLALDKAQNDLDNAVMKAPFSGVVVTTGANPGDQVTAGTTIAQIVNTNNIELDAQVDEATYGQITSIQTADGRVTNGIGLPVTVRMDSVPRPLTGFITSIIPSGTTTQGVVLIPIVITLTQQAGLPPVGASASAITIILQAKANALAVQSRYIYRDASGSQVVDVIKDGKRVPTKVDTTGGIVSTTQTEIVGGLNAGDKIALPLAKKKASSTTTVGAGGVPGLGGGAAGGGAAGGPGR